MSIGSTLPPPQNIQVRSAGGYHRTGSPLNPLNKSSTVATRKHLMNLERLLQKQPDPDPQPPEEQLSGNKGIFHGFNLTRVWPEMKAAEEMSPRHLNRLKRLLSQSPEYSPRNSLASRWREYHGRNDWAGLLDPLDENLRREVVRFGEFIQAAYHCFHSDPATPAGDSPLPRHVALPDRSYRVTRSLYATASVGLPRWVDDVAPDLGWMTQRSSWIGYVAVCDDRAEIKRMGRRDIVIALRGTATCLEWAENLRDVLVPISGDEQAKAQCGFLNLFRTRGAHVPSLAESVVEEIGKLIEKYKGEELSITVTGHSLGAALSLLVADELTGCAPDMPPIAVFSFGGPRVGNRAFADRLTSTGVRVLRIVNSQDLITRVPGMLVSEDLDRKLRSNGAGRLMDVVDSSMPWAYAHVGTELKLDTKMSPFLKPDADIACCHDLEAYLHLVDGYHASGCPFRANAKRSLWRLLNEQKSNIKRLYTRKANTLTTLNTSRNNNNMDLDLSSVISCLPSPS